MLIQKRKIAIIDRKEKEKKRKGKEKGKEKEKRGKHVMEVQTRKHFISFFLFFFKMDDERDQPT